MVPTTKICRPREPKSIPGMENIVKQNLNSSSLIRLVKDLKMLYINLKYGNSSVDRVLRNEDIFKHITILPKYDPKTYKRAIEVDWFSHEDYDLAGSMSLKNKEPLGAFAQVMTRSEYDKLMRVIGIFVYLLGKYQIEFMIGMGTLLGSFRHWDKIAWDDDAVGFGSSVLIVFKIGHVLKSF